MTRESCWPGSSRSDRFIDRDVAARDCSRGQRRIFRAWHRPPTNRSPRASSRTRRAARATIRSPNRSTSCTGICSAAAAALCCLGLGGRAVPSNSEFQLGFRACGSAATGLRADFRACARHWRVNGSLKCQTSRYCDFATMTRSETTRFRARDDFRDDAAICVAESHDEASIGDRSIGMLLIEHGS